MGKNFTTFQPGFDNEVFYKDVGIIPIIFQKHLGYSCNFLCYEINGDYDMLIKEGIKVTFIDNENTLNSALRETDVLMLYGIYDYNLKMILKYKELNPKGKIYLKLDMNIHWLRNMNMDLSLTEVLNKCDLITVECKTLKNHIKEHWPVNVEYIPNGYYKFSDDVVNYDEKENLIITVGRLGSYEKATEVLLQGFKEAFPKIRHWKLKLIGNIEDSFKPYIEDFFKNNPQLKDNVIFTGKIDDRKLLEEEYKKAKIFCLSSRFEGFPNVFPEASIKGCYIISSNIDPAYDITDDKKYGDIFGVDNPLELAEILTKICLNEEHLKEISYSIQKYTKENFNWIKLCERIEYYINMPKNFSMLSSLIVQRGIIESPSSILDLCGYPIGYRVIEEIADYNENNIIIDRIQPENSKLSSSFKGIYNNIHYGDISDALDKLPKYDVILLSDIIENLVKEDAFKLIDNLLNHTNKKLIIATTKKSSKVCISKYSFIDFYKYDFSCNTIKVNDNEMFIISIYPGMKKENPLDKKYSDFKISNTDKIDYSKKLRIAYVLPHKSVTGGLKVLIKQMKQLKERGHTITGILQGEYTGSVFPDTYKIAIDKEIIISYSDKLDNYLKDYDVVVCGFVNDWINVEDINLPAVLFEQGYETLFGDYKNYDLYREKDVKSYFDNLYSSKQSLIISVSSILSEILYYRYGRLCDVIPNGIDLSLYYPKDHNNGDSTKIALIGSPYLDFKGFDIALNVLERLTRLNFKIEVTWICQEKPYFEVPINIKYIVNPNEKLLTETIRENEILLSTSWYESFALPPLEAMASGVAVVTTDNGGIRTYGKDGYNCLIVDCGDTNSLLTAIITLIFNKKKKAELIANGVKTVAKFNIENTTDLLEKTLYTVSDFYKASSKNK